MSTEQERIDAVVDAITFENGHYISDDRRQVAEAAIAAADATRPKFEVTDTVTDAEIEVSDYEVGVAWALYCEHLLHDNVTPITMRQILESFAMDIRGQIRTQAALKVTQS